MRSHGTDSRVVEHAGDLADGASTFIPFGSASELTAVAALFNGRGVWTVRVLRRRARPWYQPLVYGEEWRDATSAVRRAREIAEGLAAGQKP